MVYTVGYYLFIDWHV